MCCMSNKTYFIYKEKSSFQDLYSFSAIVLHNIKMKCNSTIVKCNINQNSNKP